MKFFFLIIHFTKLNREKEGGDSVSFSDNSIWISTDDTFIFLNLILRI